MRRAWLFAIAISLAAHAAVLVVAVHTLGVPARVDVASGEQGASRFRIRLVDDPLTSEPTVTPQTEREIEVEPELRVDVVSIEAPPEATDQPSRPQAEAEPITRTAEDEQQPGGGDAVPGTEAQPLARHNGPPSYPLIARRHGWEGTVLLDVEVRADGRVASVTVAESSGYVILDRAAVDAVRAWRFEPAQRLGEPVDDLVRLPVRFQLVSP